MHSSKLHKTLIPFRMLSIDIELTAATVHVTIASSVKLSKKLLYFEFEMRVNSMVIVTINTWYDPGYGCPRSMFIVPQMHKYGFRWLSKRRSKFKDEAFRIAFRWDNEIELFTETEVLF